MAIIEAKSPETGIFLEFFDSFGSMSSTFYGYKLPTTGSSLFEGSW